MAVQGEHLSTPLLMVLSPTEKDLSLSTACLTPRSGEERKRAKDKLCTHIDSSSLFALSYASRASSSLRLAARLSSRTLFGNLVIVGGNVDWVVKGTRLRMWDVLKRAESMTR